MGRSVVVAVVGKLLWAMRWRTGLLVATVGVGVLLGGGMALANVPPGDTTGSATAPMGDTGSGTTPSTDTGSGTTPSGDTGSGTTPSGDTGSGTTPSGDTGSGNTGSVHEPVVIQKDYEKYGAMAYAPSLIRDRHNQVSYIRTAATLREAKNLAHDACVEFGSRYPEYKRDCQGVAWVRNGWLALAKEVMVTQRPQGYLPRAGWAWAKTAHEAKADALRQCYRANPYNAECDIDRVDNTIISGAFAGGPWHTQ
jgi:hypothetical protein